MSTATATWGFGRETLFRQGIRSPGRRRDPLRHDLDLCAAAVPHGGYVGRAAGDRLETGGGTTRSATAARETGALKLAVTGAQARQFRSPLLRGIFGGTVIRPGTRAAPWLFDNSAHTCRRGREVINGHGQWDMRRQHKPTSRSSGDLAAASQLLREPNHDNGPSPPQHHHNRRPRPAARQGHRTATVTLKARPARLRPQADVHSRGTWGAVGNPRSGLPPYEATRSAETALHDLCENADPSGEYNRAGDGRIGDHQARG